MFSPSTTIATSTSLPVDAAFSTSSLIDAVPHGPPGSSEQLSTSRRSQPSLTTTSLNWRHSDGAPAVARETQSLILDDRDYVVNVGAADRFSLATNGQVAYVYVPNTAGLGHEYFKRYFYPQANRKAIIIDERFNGGGQIANYYIDMLQQPYHSHWNTRYGRDFKTPSASIQGPKVMLIDETAGSGGDMLPWMLRKFKVGTLVGKRTWGGLVGALGFPEFIDGASVTAPNLAIWTKEGFIVEKVGVPPDVEIEQIPSEVIKGNNPQHQKAIEIALEELKKNPTEEPKRPPFPVKTKN